MLGFHPLASIPLAAAAPPATAAAHAVCLIDGSLIFKAPGTTDLRVYLTSAGHLLAKAGASPGDRAVTLAAGALVAQ